MPPFSIELVWSGLISLTLLGLGTYYLIRETGERRRNNGYRDQPAADRQHFRRQYQRRLIGSSLLILAGLAIFVGQSLLDWPRSPRLYAWLWISVMLGLLGIISLAAADLVAIQRYARRHEKRLAKDRQQMIERQLEQYRAERDSQSRTPPDFDAERN